jgi:hypothetical protein
MSDIKYTVLEMTQSLVVVAFKTPAGEWKIAKFLRFEPGQTVNEFVGVKSGEGEPL